MELFKILVENEQTIPVIMRTTIDAATMCCDVLTELLASAPSEVSLCLLTEYSQDFRLLSQCPWLSWPRTVVLLAIALSDLGS